MRTLLVAIAILGITLQYTVLDAAESNPAVFSKIAEADFNDLVVEIGNRILTYPAKDVMFDREQSFRVKDGNDLAYDLVPVHYDPGVITSRGGAVGNNHCGLIFDPAGSLKPYLVATIGDGFLETLSCDSLKAVGVVDARQGPYGMIALVYAAHSPNYEVSIPVVLSFNKKNELFTVNEQLSVWLGNKKGALTIKAIRALLNKREKENGNEFRN